MKKLVAMCLVLAMVLSLVGVVFADETVGNDAYVRTPGSNIVVHKASGRQIDLDHLKVACVHKTYGYFWFDCADYEGQAWAEAHPGSTWNYYAPATQDAASQMAVLMDALTTDPDILIVCPTAGEAVNEAIAMAHEKGTLCICIEGDESMTNCDYLLEPFDSKPMVKWYVDELVKKLGDEFEYVLFVGKLTTPFQVKWCNEFYDYATSTYPKLKSYTARGEYLEHMDSSDTACEMGKQIILGHPEITVMWSSSAGGTGGLARAVDELGVKDTMYACGHAGVATAETRLNDGTLTLGSIHYPGAWGWTAAELGRKVIAGESLEDGLGFDEYENLTFDGKWVYGEAWYPLTLDTVNIYRERWPEL